MIIDPKVIDIIERARTNGPNLVLVGQLDPREYRAVNKALELAGGKWDRRAKAHVFPGDAQAAVSDMLLVGEITDVKKEFDAFYTPPVVAEQVIAYAEIKPGHRVLEPSAGEGALAYPAAAAAEGVHVTAYDIRPIEHDPQPHRLGRDSLVYWTPLTDWLTVSPNPVYDRVVMNPPFSREQDMKHVRHAFEFLKPGGRLVSVMSPAWAFRTSKTCESFREFFGEFGVSEMLLPSGSFKSSGTMVNTTIVVLEKPHA